MPFADEFMWCWEAGSLHFHSGHFCRCVKCSAARALADALFGWLP
jgi:hypothetical protein